jgi:uncharacterized protein (DUF952 family)
VYLNYEPWGTSVIISRSPAGAHAGDYTVLKINSAKLKSEVKFEAAAPVGDKQTSNFGSSDVPKEEEILFPHLFGSIDFAAVEAELTVRRTVDGRFLAIDGL